MADSKPMTTPNAALVDCGCTGSADILPQATSGQSIRFYVQCDRCLLRTGTHASEASACEAWNTALQSDAAQARVEALEEAVDAARKHILEVLADDDEDETGPHPWVMVEREHLRALKEPTK